MDEEEKKGCPEPPYLKFWALIMVTFFLGWATGVDILQKLLHTFFEIGLITTGMVL